MVSNLGGKNRKTSLGQKSKNASPKPEKTDKARNSKMNSAKLPKLSKSDVHGIKLEPPQTQKKIRSFQMLVEAMKPSKAELEFRQQKSNETDALRKYSKSFKCTKCNISFSSDSAERQKLQIHPCLGVLMCQNCCNYYGNGEFSLDSEGEDKYCRWCGEGGTIFGCSKCICGFCVSCIKKHFGSKYLSKVEKDDDWQCFFCNPEPLWEERYICSLAVQSLENKANKISSEPSLKDKKKGSENAKKRSRKSTKSKKKKVSTASFQDLLNSDSSTSMELSDFKSLLKKGDNTTRKRIFTSSEDELEVTLPGKKQKKMKLTSTQVQNPSQREENFENLKELVLEKLERILKLSEYQLAFGLNWSSKTLKKLVDPKHITTPEVLKSECEKIKWFFSVLSTYLVEFCNSVDSIENSLQRKDGAKASNNISQETTEPNGFSAVVQFLAFITTQVKTFMEKGLNLQDILKAELYDDNKVIGIKKKLKPSVGTSSETSNGASQTINFNIEKSSDGPERNSEVEEGRADDDESRDSFRLKIDQSFELRENDEDEMSCDESPKSSEKTILRKKDPRIVDPKEDFLHILEILEHA